MSDGLVIGRRREQADDCVRCLRSVSDLSVI